MNHVVYLDRKAKELENLQIGTKTMIIRGAMGRKMPYGRVNKDDVLYFIENKGDGLIKAKAVVSDVFLSDKLEKEDSIQLVEKYQDRLLLDKIMLARYGGKRYLVFIEIKDFIKIGPFNIDLSEYKNMDDWLPLENIENVFV